MKSITIHGLDGPLDELIRQKATDQGMSLNRTIKKLLEQSLGIRPKNENDHKKDFLDLFGVWTETDASEFTKALEDFDKINSEDWI